MSSLVAVRRTDFDTITRTALRGSARLWFVVAVAGQLIFAIYVAALYGRAAILGDWAAWNSVMPHGFVAGDPIGNAVVAVHLAAAFAVLVAGAMQLVPRIRDRAPAVHRWTGRLYLLAALGIGLGGLYMVWIRGTVGDLSQAVGISVNAGLVLAFAALALRAATARQIAVHRRWALRLFLVMSGVWFFRIGFMLWMVINGRPVGFDPDTFTGPFLTALGIGQYVVPLVVLELYLRATERGTAPARLAVAGLLLVLTVATAIGIVAATIGMWLPRI